MKLKYTTNNKCVLNKAESLERQGFHGAFALFECKIFAAYAAKTLHFPSTRNAATMEIRIEIMAEFHKNG